MIGNLCRRLGTKRPLRKEDHHRRKKKGNTEQDCVVMIITVNRVTRHSGKMRRNREDRMPLLKIFT